LTALLLACASPPTSPADPASLTLAYQSTVDGEIEPCG
jgi:hypothetical protein